MRRMPMIIAVATLTAAFPVLIAPAAAAPAVQAFDQAAFDAAQKAGRPILIWVHAPWCPVCRQQQKTIERLTAEPAMRAMQVFRIDYDTQKLLWRRFGATQQSTLIAFRGRRETGRIAHETDDTKVNAVIRGAIA
ncbi:thioredoxin family protein [Sphingomonas dokdonensis]|uniref:Soluble secreted antigen MPT53 n=1 Tax=Sphingomonas dokdonensis TaxID=344880 RepID=A0A245ZUZ4_9SPHN|nr:thioredoxin family protein [Sphingomonas dokdonensis]OWK33564.1 soluble secreted antigen MPT53 precursor [Sphingomonas dokdonensis]